MDHFREKAMNFRRHVKNFYANSYVTPTEDFIKTSIIILVLGSACVATSSPTKVAREGKVRLPDISRL